MPRPLNREMTKAQKKAHELQLQKRREKQQAKRAIRRGEEAAAAAATSDSEGEMNFQELVERENLIITGKRRSKAEQAAIAGSQPPKTVTMAREHLSEAFEFIGGVAALVVWGRENLTEFYRLWARMIPKDAPSEDQAMPLESLLAKLAEQSDVPVMQAAMQIGAQELEKGRAGAEAEEAEAALRPQPDKIVYN